MSRENDDVASRGNAPASPPLGGGQLAGALTAGEQRFGLLARPTRPVSPRRDYAAPTYDPLGNVKANGGNRSYAYVTNAESWAARRRGGV